LVSEFINLLFLFPGLKLTLKKYILNIIIVLLQVPAYLYARGADLSAREMKTVTTWELSSIFDISGLVTDQYPHFSTIFNARWDSVSPDDEGWIYIDRNRGTADMSAYGVYARSFFMCEDSFNYRFSIEFSEEISIFLNGKFIVHNDIKTVSQSDKIEIELYPRKGLNELFLFIISRSADWKFRIMSSPGLHPLKTDHSESEIAWETEASLLTPESVAYDPENDVYYVSNYDYMYYTKDYPTGYISKVSPDGIILEHEWIKGLFAPTGICVVGDRLYIVVRNGILVVGTKKGNYIDQYDIPDAVFLNDVTADSLGRIYITDSSEDPSKPDIYILEKKQIKPWLQSEAVSNANGIYEYHGKLMLGNNGEGLFQAVSINDKSIETICSLGPGTIDGIRIDNEGNWLVSHWEGKIFRINRSGQITEIFDTSTTGKNAADFEFSEKSGTLIIPTFSGNNVTALKIK
jgi:hypothetical protein